MTERTESKKELFLTESMKLFAEKGYDAVSVAEIAEAVGCSAPALYKHYKSKQALLDALLKKSNDNFDGLFHYLNLDFYDSSDKAQAFVDAGIEEQIRIIQEIFLHSLNDEFPSLLRKFMTVEQFHRPEFSENLNERYFYSQIETFEKLMQYFIDTGKYREGSARTMVIQYISPIIVYISVCDRQPDRVEEALKSLADHIRQFDSMYRVA